MLRILFLIIGLVYAASSQAQQAAAPPSADQQLFRDIYKELIEINTTDSVGDTNQAAEAMAARLKAGGIPAADVQVFSTAPRKGNLVARYRGTGASGKKPLLLAAHLDVVEAKREDWAFDPFKLQEVDGYFRARGAIDDKSMAAIFVANLIQYKKEGFKPDRDIIVALTTDEELSDSPNNGMKFLLANHRDLIDADFAINEGSGGVLKDGKPQRMGVQLAEKIYQTYKLEVKDAGGHSSQPKRDNPIYRLAAALQRIEAYQFPIRVNDVTRVWFQKTLSTEDKDTGAVINALLSGSTDMKALEPLLAKPNFNAQMHTTCVATMIEGGHAENALPQTARATVNCRIMPEEKVVDVEQALLKAVDDPKVSLNPVGTAVLSPPSPPNAALMQAIETVMKDMKYDVPLLTNMSAGYTDSRWLRNAGINSYGFSGLFSDGAKSGVHGLNEQVGVKDLYDSKDFQYRLVKLLTAGKPGE